MGRGKRERQSRRRRVKHKLFCSKRATRTLCGTGSAARISQGLRVQNLQTLWAAIPYTCNPHNITHQLQFKKLKDYQTQNINTAFTPRGDRVGCGGEETSGPPGFLNVSFLSLNLLKFFFFLVVCVSLHMYLHIISWIFKQKKKSHILFSC